MSDPLAVIVLERLIDRLERDRVSDIGPKVYSAWVTTEADFAPVVDRVGGGKLHLAGALREARAALASGDAERIAQAALLCQGIERTGREVERGRERRRRQAGGKHTGSKQTAAAEEFWAPWVDMFRKITLTGVRVTEARRRVVNEMSRAGVLLPSTGEFPSDEAIRRRLK